MDKKDIEDKKPRDRRVSDHVRSVVDFVIAKQSSDQLESYLARGRGLEGLTVGELRSAHAAAFAVFVRDPHGAEAQQAHSDTTAEHELRGLAVEQGDEADMALLMKAVQQSYDSMSEEDLLEADANLHEMYRVGRQQSN